MRILRDVHAAQLAGLASQPGLGEQLLEMRMEYLGTYTGPLVPYQRMTQRGRFSPRAKRYHASQNRLIPTLSAQPYERPLTTRIVRPYKLDLAIHVPPTKAGAIPRNKGDADNYLKAFLDALQRAGIVEGDDLSRYRGGVLDVQLGDEWRFDWRIYEI